MSPYGKAKKGYSLPKGLANKDLEYGMSSYHKKQVSDMQNVLSNEGVRDQLMGNI